MPLQVGIITVSDRAAAGVYEDLSGPALRHAAESRGWAVVFTRVVPDEKPEIQRAIREGISHGARVILSSGGTGVSPRDITPEAVTEIASRVLPGFGEAMRAESRKLTPHALLSRNLAVTVGSALVVCLPGKPSGAVECLGFVAEAIPHCIQILQGSLDAHP